MDISWTEWVLAALAGLEKPISIRVKNAVERFAATSAGNVKPLLGIDSPEFRLRVGDYRVRFQSEGQTLLILHVRNRREAYR